MSDIKKIIDYLKGRAIKSMRKNYGELEPKMYFLILYPGQKTPVYFPVPCSRFFENKKMKSFMPTYSALCWEKKKLEHPEGIKLIAVCLITDSWQSQVDLGDKSKEEIEHIKNSGYAPSKAANRREAIATSVCFENSNEVYLLYYKRNGMNIIYEETSKATGFEGIMAELYPRGDNSALLDSMLDFYENLKNYNHN